MFAWTIYISFIGVAWLLTLKSDDAAGARRVAVITSGASLLTALMGAFQYSAEAGLVDVANVPWIAHLGIRYHLAVDGISVVLLVLTGLASFVGILFSMNIEKRAKEFFAFYLALIAGVFGVFLSFDLFLLFVFYEIAIVPKYFLIAIWGSTRREYAAMKLALYSFVGSAMVLIGLLAAFVLAGANTFSLVELAKFPFPREAQMWAFPARVHGLRDPRRHVAFSHLGANWSLSRAYGGVHAASRCHHEARRLRLPARGHGAVPSWE